MSKIKRALFVGAAMGGAVGLLFGTNALAADDDHRSQSGTTERSAFSVDSELVQCPHPDDGPRVVFELGVRDGLVPAELAENHAVVAVLCHQSEEGVLGVELTLAPEGQHRKPAQFVHVLLSGPAADTDALSLLGSAINRRTSERSGLIEIAGDGPDIAVLAPGHRGSVNGGQRVAISDLDWKGVTT